MLGRARHGARRRARRAGAGRALPDCPAYGGGVRAFPREVLTGSKCDDRTGDLRLFGLRICIGKLLVNYVMVGLSYEKCKEML